jgi:hypothetical protein
MRDVSMVVPEADFTLSLHFLKEFERHDQPASHFLHAVDHHQSQGLVLKSYLVPRSYGDPVNRRTMTLNELNEAISKLDPNNSSHHTLKVFLETNSEGRLLNPGYVVLPRSFLMQGRSAKL